MSDDYPASDPSQPSLSRELKRYYLYQVFAILWIFPSLGALILLWPVRKLDWANPKRALDEVSVEQWIALLLIGLQITFALKTWEYARLSRAERSKIKCPSTSTN